MPEAIEYLQRSLTIREELGWLEAQAANLHNLGVCHEAQGDLPRALDHYQRALTLWRRMGLPDHHPDVRGTLRALTRLGAAPTG